MNSILPSRWYFPLCWLVLIILGLAVYGQTFGYGFVFDDWSYIVKNSNIRQWDHMHYIWLSFTKVRLMGFYSFALNYQINHLDPCGYHVFNFILHLTNALLVWAISRLLFKIVGQSQEEISFLIALLFLVHPCQTQAVSYISQRFESLATFFYFGSFYFYLRARSSTALKDQILNFMLSVAAAVLGLFTKEVAVTIPLLILAAEGILFNKGKSKQAKIFFSRFAIMVIVFAMIYFALFMYLEWTSIFDIYFRFRGISDSHDGDIITGWTYVLTQLRVFLTFLRLLVWPFYQNVDYDYPVSVGLFHPFSTFLGLGVIAMMIYLIFRLRRPKPLMALGLTWLLITFSINTVPRVNVIFEHKLYLMSFGFILFFVLLLSDLIKSRIKLFGLLSVLIVGLALISWQRNHVWKDDLTLWQDAVRHSPHKARVLDNLGAAYFGSGDMNQAMSAFNKAIEFNPHFAEAYYNRAHMEEMEGQPIAAVDDYSKAISLNPRYPDAYNNRGQIYRQKNRLIPALEDFNTALKLDPDDVGVYYNRALIFLSQQRFIQARDDFQKVLSLDPDNYLALINLAGAYFCLHDYPSAVQYLDQAQRQNPRDARVYKNRALCYLAMGLKNEALKDQAMLLSL